MNIMSQILGCQVIHIHIYLIRQHTGKAECGLNKVLLDCEKKKCLLLGFKIPHNILNHV